MASSSDVDMLDVLVDKDGEGTLQEGSDFESWLTQFLYLACIKWVQSYFCMQRSMH